MLTALDAMDTKKLTLVYPSGLGSSAGRASHRKCEDVGSIPTQVFECYWFEKGSSEQSDILGHIMILNYTWRYHIAGKFAD